MPLVYVDRIDITPRETVVVTGHLASTGLSVSLSEYVYTDPPEDGVWEFDLTVKVENPIVLPMLVPFVAEAAWGGGEDSNGARVYVKDGTVPPLSITQRKASVVEAYNTTQHNYVMLRGAGYCSESEQITVDLAYSGGCFKHRFDLEWDGSLLKSNPPQYLLNLVDASEEDPCEAILSERVVFDVDVPGMTLRKPSTVLIRTPGGGHELRVDVKN